MFIKRSRGKSMVDRRSMRKAPPSATSLPPQLHRAPRCRHRITPCWHVIVPTAAQYTAPGLPASYLHNGMTNPAHSLHVFSVQYTDSRSRNPSARTCSACAPHSRPPSHSPISPRKPRNDTMYLRSKLHRHRKSSSTHSPSRATRMSAFSSSPVSTVSV